MLQQFQQRLPGLAFAAEADFIAKNVRGVLGGKSGVDDVRVAIECALVLGDFGQEGLQLGRKPRHLELLAGDRLVLGQDQAFRAVDGIPLAAFPLDKLDVAVFIEHCALLALPALNLNSGALISPLPA